MSRKSKKRKKARRVRNKQAKAAMLAPTSGAPRVRRFFSAKARRGDEVEVAMAFSGVEIPVDPKSQDPGVALARGHAAVVAWKDAGNPTNGSA